MPTTLHGKTCPDCKQKISAFMPNYNHRDDCRRACSDCGGEVTKGIHHEGHYRKSRDTCRVCGVTLDPSLPFSEHCLFCVWGPTE